jgi:mannosyltransferase
VLRRWRAARHPPSGRPGATWRDGHIPAIRGVPAVICVGVRRVLTRRLDGLPGRALVIAAVVGLTALGAILRMRALAAPYWIDEGISVGISSHPFAAIPGLLRQDGSPPLYYLLLHVWIALLGSTPAATHALSAILAIGCVPVAYWAVAPFDAWAGLTAAALMALDPYVGLYADETRMYSLLLLLGLAVCGAFVRCFVLRRRAHVATFAAFAALTLYAHPWGAFLVGASGLAWLALVVVGPDRRGLVRDGLFAFGGAAVLFAPWVPTLLYQAAHTGAPWSHRPTHRSLVRAVSRMWSGQRAELLLLPAAVVGLAVAAVRGGAQARRGLLAVAVIAAATIGSAYAYSHFGTPAWALRYLVIVLAPLALLTALGLGRLPVVGPLAVLAAVLLAWHWRPTVATLNHKSNVTQVAHEMAPLLAPGTLVFSTQPEQVPALALELPAGMRFRTPLGRVADPGVMDWRDAMLRLRAARFAADLEPELRELRRGRRLLLVQPVFSHPDSPWTLKIREIARRWGRALRRTRLLRRVRVVRPSHGSSRSTVSATLLERR